MKTNWKRNITLFIATQFISLFGSSLVQYAMSWHINLETQSGTMMAISIVCGFLPTFFVSPFAGVWADRYNKKLIIILSDSIIAITTLGTAIAFMLGFREIWLLFVVMAIRGLGQGIQGPAVNAMIPSIVPEDKLMKVNATNGTLQSAMMLVSPMAAAALMSLATIESIFFIDVFTALLAVLILFFFLHVSSKEKGEVQEAKGYFHDMRMGMTYISNHGFVKQLFSFCVVFFLMAGPVAFLSPLQVTRLFGTDTWRLSAVEVAFSIGMLICGVVLMSTGGFKNRHHSMTLSLFVFAAGGIALGALPVFWAYIVIMLILGLSMPLFHTPFTVLLQEKIEPEYLGRVFGFFGMLSSLGMPMGILVFGPLSDVISLNWIFIGTGIVLLISSIFMMLNKSLIEAGKQLPPKPELDASGDSIQ